MLRTPNLADDQILRVVGGLRPCRRGGLRLESQELGSKHIIHNYGHGGCGITLSMGTAHACADLVEHSTSKEDQIAVLGAGVVGLTTARELALRGYKVRVYAKQAGIDTLSVLAGALFLPVGIEYEHPDIGREQFLQILIKSKQSLDALDPTRYGIESLPVFEPEYAHDPDFLFTNGTIAPPVQIDKLPLPGPPRSGRTFESMFIHTPRFLNALIDDLQSSGVAVQSHTMTSADDIESLSEDTIINCMALGSRTIFNDTAMYPARGLLVHMKPQNLGYIIHDGYKYMFPREDALILGGCFDEHVWDDTPDQKIADEILSHHRRFFGVD
jgi:glycine/D-amino acid oxidase-like deaminating enzyme